MVWKRSRQEDRQIDKDYLEQKQILGQIDRQRWYRIELDIRRDRQKSPVLRQKMKDKYVLGDVRYQRNRGTVRQIDNRQIDRMIRDEGRQK